MRMQSNGTQMEALYGGSYAIPAARLTGAQIKNLKVGEKYSAGSAGDMAERVPLTPSKVASIAVLSREMIDGGGDDASSQGIRRDIAGCGVLQHQRRRR